jgi:hypothetical protein
VLVRIEVQGELFALPVRAAHQLCFRSLFVSADSAQGAVLRIAQSLTNFVLSVPALQWRVGFEPLQFHSDFPACVSPGRGTAACDVPNQSTQLAVLAAAPVISAELRKIAIMRLLAAQAQANASDGIPACLRYCAATFCAVTQTRTVSQATLRALDPILYGCVNLILYRAVASPTCRHVFLLK